MAVVAESCLSDSPGKQALSKIPAPRPSVADLARQSLFDAPAWDDMPTDLDGESQTMHTVLRQSRRQSARRSSWASRASGCALEVVTELSKGDRIHMRVLMVKTWLRVALVVYFIIHGVVQRNWAIVASYTLACLMHALIRTIVDAVYDTAGLVSSEKRWRQLKLAVLNFIQLRIVLDAQECIHAGAVGISLNITLMVEALAKAVPLCIIDLANIFLLLADVAHDPVNTATISVLVLALIAKAWGVSAQVWTFEMMTNAARCGPVRRKLRAYFFVDVVVRCLSFGTITSAIAASENLPPVVGLVPFLLLYLNRVWMMAGLYVSRGFIYPPTPPDTVDNTSTWTKLLFACFPAGFVQLLTDFPFNGDLATRPRRFLVHQIASLGEALACVMISTLMLDFIGMLCCPWAAYIVIVLWVTSWSLKLWTFFFAYYPARTAVATCHVDKMSRHSSRELDDRIGAVHADHARAVAEGQFLIYLIGSCPICKTAVASLKRLHVEGVIQRNFDDFGIAERNDIVKMLERELEKATNRSFVGPLRAPLIWFNAEFIGGYEALEVVLSSKTDDGEPVFKTRRVADHDVDMEAVIQVVGQVAD